ncbi:unnamed protein product [Cuscuta campestris]|uniref:Uncharacterized protein n=1 Tax=Cuscuta campestris TaxID=132261 RepID=A0A484JZA2_9ASTE|nr:unnamed protein product [Cuscuta campestris]
MNPVPSIPNLKAANSNANHPAALPPPEKDATRESADLIVPRSPTDRKAKSCSGRRVYFAMLNTRPYEDMPEKELAAILDLYAFSGNGVMDLSALPAAQEKGNTLKVFKFNKAMAAKPVASYHHCQERAFMVCSGSEFYCFGGYVEIPDHVKKGLPSCIPDFGVCWKPSLSGDECGDSQFSSIPSNMCAERARCGAVVTLKGTVFVVGGQVNPNYFASHPFVEYYSVDENRWIGVSSNPVEIDGGKWVKEPYLTKYVVCGAIEEKDTIIIGLMKLGRFIALRVTFDDDDDSCRVICCDDGRRKRRKTSKKAVRGLEWVGLEEATGFVMTSKVMKTILQKCYCFSPRATGVVCEGRMFWVDSYIGTKLVMWDMVKGKCCVIDMAEAGLLPSSDNDRYDPRLCSLEGGNKLGLFWMDNLVYMMAEDVVGDTLEQVKHVRKLNRSERHYGTRLTCFTVGGYEGVDDEDDDGVLKKHPEIQIHYQRECICPVGSYLGIAFEVEA